MGCASSPPPARHPRPLSGWCPAHGGPGDRAVITFNGEIYNFRNLRRRLAVEGQDFQSTGDTAVMLRALGLHGPNAVSWLRGMFAFACWDPTRRRLLLARDHLGIKPLYLARSSDPDGGWSVAFASELRALLASGLLGTPRLDPQAVASSVWNGFVVGPGTAVRDVELLWPGRLLELDGAGKEIHHEDFWRIPDRAPDPTMDESGLAAILEEALRLHLASDVPLAVFLSGGVDSSVWPSAPPTAPSTPSLWPSRSTSSTRGPSQGGSPPPSGPSTVR